jgi:hypothetical protein
MPGDFGMVALEGRCFLVIGTAKRKICYKRKLAFPLFRVPCVSVFSVCSMVSEFRALATEITEGMEKHRTKTLFKNSGR